MTFADGLVLIAIVFAVVAWPFFRRPSGDAAVHASPESLNQWERQKAEAYGAIKDAEFDAQMGKLSEVDFQFIRDKYVAKAMEAIGALEQAKKKARATAPRDLGAVRFLFCPECGNKLPSRARFCPGCGRSLRADDAA